MALSYAYPSEVYIPAAVRYGYITIAEARAEYSRLRSVAEKRLKRLSRTEGARYSAYQMYGREGFTPLPRDATPADVGRALADVHHFLEMKTSSISQIRESQRQALKTLQERGYSFVNKSNIKEFGEFMESARQAGVARANRGGSPIIVELYETVKRLQIPPEIVRQNFAEWLAKKGELDKLPTPKPGEKSLNYQQIRKKLKIRNKKRK